MSTRRTSTLGHFSEARSYRTLRIRLAQKFDEFGEAERIRFLSKFQELTGLDDDDLRRIKFRRGCVIAEIELPAGVLRRILQQSKLDEANMSPDDFRNWREFVEDFSIKDISDTTPTPVRLSVQRKTQPDRRDHAIFVHGVTGNAATFGMLPKFIERAVGCRAIVYEYPSSKFSSSPEVPYLALNLDNWIRENAGSAENIAFVAHSLGGLVVRRFIIEQKYREDGYRLDRRVRQVSLIASPEDGSLIASIAGKFSANRQFQDLSPNSTMLLDLNREWERWVKMNVPTSCRIRCIVGMDDDIVPINAARGLDPNPIPLFGVDHSSIVKPSSPSDEIVCTLARLLKEAGIGGAALAQEA